MPAANPTDSSAHNPPHDLAGATAAGVRAAHNPRQRKAAARRLADCSRASQRDSRSSTHLERARDRSFHTLAWLALTLTLAACEASAGASTVTRLTGRGAIAVPDTTRESDWLGRIGDLRLDIESGNLFGIDLDVPRVVELDTDGQFVRFYGQPGSGPGELENPRSVSFTADRVFVLDQSNGKIVVFDREARPVKDLRLDHRVWHFDVVDGDQLATSPGGGDEVVAVYDSTMRLVRSIGRKDDYVRACAHCLVEALPYGRLALVDQDQPSVTLFTTRGTQVARINLDTVPTMRAWIETYREGSRAAAVPSAGKLWIWDAAMTSDGRIAMSMLPPTVGTTGRELWVLEPELGHIRRYDFGRPDVGHSVSSYPNTFTVGLIDGAIYEFRSPDTVTVHGPLQ